MGDPKKYLWDVVVNGALASPVVPVGVRSRVLRMLGVKVGRGVRVRHRVHLTSNKLTLGDGCYINVGAIIQNAAHVTVGENVAIAPYAVVTTVGHDMSDPNRRQGIPKYGPVDLGRGSWVGAAAVVLPGVEVGHGAIVAAGAVVSTDCAADWLHGGLPARPLKSLAGAGERERQAEADLHAVRPLARALQH